MNHRLLPWLRPIPLRGVLHSATLAGFLVGCTDLPAPTGESPGGGLLAAKRPRPSDPVPLSITFSQGTGGTDALKSDCGDPATCPYVESEDLIAHLSTGGNLSFDLAEADVAVGPSGRFIDFSSGCGAPCFTGLAAMRMASAEHDNGNGTTGFTGLAVGGTGTANLGGTWYPGDGYVYSVRYGRDCAGTLVPANRVVTGHPDADTWTAVSASGYHCRRKLTKNNKEPVELLGTVGGFSMTLKRRP